MHELGPGQQTQGPGLVPLGQAPAAAVGGALLSGAPCPLPCSQKPPVSRVLTLPAEQPADQDRGPAELGEPAGSVSQPQRHRGHRGPGQQCKSPPAVGRGRRGRGGRFSARPAGLGKISKKETLGTSPLVQWLSFRAPNAGDAGSVPGEGTKTLHASWHGQQ